jgi:hypothetical protein
MMIKKVKNSFQEILLSIIALIVHTNIISQWRETAMVNGVRFMLNGMISGFRDIRKGSEKMTVPEKCNQLFEKQ